MECNDSRVCLEWTWTNFFHQLHLACLMPNSVTTMCMLQACEKLGDIKQAKHIHNFIVMRMFDLDVYVGTAFLNMYAKCINMDIVCQVLGQMFVKIVVVLLAMISR